MKLTNGLLALGLAALPASALARDDGTTNGPGVLRDDATDLVKRLGDKDYKVRRDAFKKLEAMGAEARAALEAAAKGDDAEIRWNASRLLDRLEDDSAGAQKKAGRGAQSLKVRVGADPGDPDGDDDAQGAAPTRRRIRVLGTEDLEQQMRELELRMKDFEKQFEEDGSGYFHVAPFRFRMFDHSFGGLGGGGSLQLGPGSSFQRTVTNDGKTESLSLQVDENGRVHGEQTVDGKTTKLEADSLEQLQKDHPDLLRSGPAVIAIRPGQGGLQMKRPDPNAAPAPDSQDARPRRKVKTKTPAATPSKVETPSKDAQVRDTGDDQGEAYASHRPVLGVELAPVPPEVTQFLDLGGAALQVVRVMEDMPAAKRGLKARDILLEVDGKEVHEFDDVVRALEGADPSKVPLVVLRRGERKKL
ncbi:MAG TPA: PDZ domain-containing protein [Planctomycetota bacterium]|nr:PDZ domain-containing protein [Planctomycetota bacterium]